MTAIDFDATCADMGIDPKSYITACEKVDEVACRIGPDKPFPFESFADFLTNSEILAYCRYQKLYVRYPEYFDYNGLLAGGMNG